MEMSGGAAMRDQLEMQIGELLSRPELAARRSLGDSAVRHGAVQGEGGTPSPALADDGREPFGTWLVGQTQREDEIVYLAQGARADPSFPRRANPAAVRAYLRTKRAPWEAFEQLDLAEEAYNAGEC